MAYKVRYTVFVDWVPDGAGPMSIASVQTLELDQTAPVLVAGGYPLTQANLNTALTGSSATPAAGSAMADMVAQLALALPRLQTWTTGGG